MAKRRKPARWRSKPTRSVRQQRAAADALPSRAATPIDPALDRALEQAIVQRVDAALERVERDSQARESQATEPRDRPKRGVPPRGGVSTAPSGWWRSLVWSWRDWRVRKRNARIARLFNDDTRRAHQSAAMLAVLTERVARLRMGKASDSELTEAIYQAAAIAAEYDAHAAEFDPQLDDARAQLRHWSKNAVIATVSGDADLAAHAQKCVDLHARAVRELELAVAECNAGRRRLRDAVRQLRALAARSAPSTALAQAPAQPKSK